VLGGGGTSSVGSFCGAAARGEARSVAGRQGDDAGSLFASAGSLFAAAGSFSAAILLLLPSSLLPFLLMSPPLLPSLLLPYLGLLLTPPPRLPLPPLLLNIALEALLTYVDPGALNSIYADTWWTDIEMLDVRGCSSLATQLFDTQQFLCACPSLFHLVPLAVQSSRQPMQFWKLDAGLVGTAFFVAFAVHLSPCQMPVSSAFHSLCNYCLAN
jgi:hypothetical protein